MSGFSLQVNSTMLEHRQAGAGLYVPSVSHSEKSTFCHSQLFPLLFLQEEYTERNILKVNPCVLLNI